jgi:SpoVK/Ycf46/Vps4 family AAA+-type ATPase
MADDSTFNELNQYVENVQSRAEHIREKRKRLEENPDIPKDRLYEEMVREDLDQLENCYARIHIYLKAFYKKKDKRTTDRNKILRQFFGAQIEKIFGDASLLEDLLSLDENAYFKNLERHNEL